MTLVYVLLCAFVVGAVAFGVAVLVTGADPGLAPEEPEGSAIPLPGDRPLGERDFQAVKFDAGLRGYRMAQVDVALRRAAYDVGYKEELVAVLEAEVAALRAGRQDEADALRQARLAALGAHSDAAVDLMDDPPDDEPAEETAEAEELPVLTADAEADGEIRAADAEAAGAGVPGAGVPGAKAAGAGGAGAGGAGAGAAGAGAAGAGAAVGEPVDEAKPSAVGDRS
jgi:DivIVA domain-containing protein